MDNWRERQRAVSESAVKGFVPMLECEDVKYYNFGREPDTYGTDAIYGMLSDKFLLQQRLLDNSKAWSSFSALFYILMWDESARRRRH